MTSTTNFFNSVLVSNKYVTDASNANVNIVPWVKNQLIKVYGFAVSANNADNFQLQLGGVTFMKYFGGANFNYRDNFWPFYFTGRDASANLAGTVATTSGSAAVVGTSTTFTTSYKVNDTMVTSGGDAIIISVITDDTHITLAANAANTGSGLTHYRGEDNLNIVKGTAGTTITTNPFYTQNYKMSY